MSSPTPLAGSVSVAYLQGLLDYLGRQGLDPAALLALVQLEPAILAQREQRIQFVKPLADLMRFAKDGLPIL